MIHDGDGGEERSPSGAPILRHQAPRENAFRFARGQAATLAEVEAHLEKHFGPAESVFHELLSELVHIDVHLVAPTSERDHWTLYTTGMSDLPMTTPAGAETFRYAELILKLPSTWDLRALKTTPPSEAHEHLYWPIGFLKFLSRFPHEYSTWLGMGHTIPNGDPPAPFVPGSKLCGWWLLPPLGPEEAQVAKLSDGRAVHLYVMHAVTLEEMSLKLNRGSDALLDAFGRADVSEVLHVNRPSSVRRKLFGIF